MALILILSSFCTFNFDILKIIMSVLMLEILILVSMSTLEQNKRN